MRALYAAELRAASADRRVRWIAVVLIVLLTLAFVQPWLAARATATERTAVAATERARWLGQDPQNPHSAAHYGVWVFKAPSPLAVLDPGIEPFVGRMVRIEAHRYNDAIFRTAQDASPLARAGSGSVADIVQLVASLAAILLGFSAFAADRERGTLRLALGNGVRPGPLVAARILALATILAGIVTLPAFGAGIVSAMTLDGAGWNGPVRALLWAVVQFGYLSIFLLLAVAVSLIARTARTALTVCLLAWAILCVGVPRMAAGLVESLSPTPSQQRTMAEIEREILLFKRADNHAARERALLARYGAETPDQMPISLRGALLHIQEQHDYGVYDRHLGRFNDRLEAQDRLYGWAGVLSPMVASQSVSQALAGSDFRHHTHFLRAAERYRRTLSDTMNLDLVAQPDAAYVADRSVWEKVPDFAYAPPSLIRSIGFATVPLTILLLWLVAAGAFVAVAARRLRP